MGIGAMNVLLLSMPDSFEHMPVLAIRMPNGALTSLAGNVDPHHHVVVADLILVQDRVRKTLEDLVREHRPDLVGLSVMTFQRKTAWKVMQFVRSLKPDIQIVVGGYDPSLAREAYMAAHGTGADFIVRGEGEATFNELLRAMEQGCGYDGIAGLTYREEGEYHHNPSRPPQRLDDGTVRLPRRDARVLKGYHHLGRGIDVVETSRGCTYDCSFCSIIEMRGRNFFTFPIERVLDDIRDARDHGAQAIFIVDDNVMLNVKRFEELCHAIIDAGLNTLDYHVQAMTSTIANHGEKLAPLMRRAGFRYVFLGIENILDEDLTYLKARAKNTRKEQGRKAGNASLKAIEYVHQNKMYVVGGLIVGSPDDTRDSIEANLEFARRYVDWPYIQHPMPYPGTPMTFDLRERGLIADDEVEHYDGTTAVVHTKHVAAEEVEYLRWRAERWMKFRHMPAALLHDPLFIARNAHRLAAHTLRGSTLRTLLGLEDDRKAFERFRHIYRDERKYL